MEEYQVNIPDGWKSYVGNEILKVKGGYAFKSNDYKDEGILLVRIGNVGNGNFVFKDVIYVPKRFQITHSNFQLWKGDVLMGLTGDLGKICILKEGDFPYFLNQRVGRFIPTERIDNEYLFYLVSSSFVQSKFDAFFAGGAQKNISPKQIESIDYVIPKSKTEQTQITTILSKVDEAIAQTEQLIAKYTRIKTGLMQDLLTKGIDEHGNIRSEETHEFKDSPLGRIPKEWECVLFDEIISSFDSGWSPNCEARQATIGEWGSLKTTAITWGGYDSNENKKLPDNLIPRKRLEVAFDDILITRVGPRERVGVMVHVDDDRSKLMLSDNMLRIKLNKSKELFYPFIPLMVSSDKIQREFKNKIAGLAEAQVVINQQSIKSTYILIPSKEEQTTIFNKSQVIKKAVNVEQIKLSKLQSLKTGLMQDLLSGKVRVNHLIKETASI